ncbi:MAG: MATE family efflux transporter [Gammaproteobacteria bacterium]
MSTPQDNHALDSRSAVRLCVELIAISWPLMLNNLFNIGINAADTLMAGRLGASQLAAVALGSSVWITLFLAGLGVVMAVGPSVAQLYGARQFAQIGGVVHHGFILGLVVAIVVIIAMHSMGPLMLAANIEPNVVILAEGYLSAMSWGVVGCYWYHCLRQMNEGLGRTIPIMLVMGTSLPINIGLNYIFMYGALGWPKLGAVGAGLGSGITFWLMFIFIALYTYRSNFYRRFEIWQQFTKPRSDRIFALIKIGLPIGLSFMLQAGLFTAVAMIMGSLGTEVVAAHAVTLNFASIVFMLPLGIGMGATSLVGRAIGAGRPSLARRYGIAAYSMAFVMMLISASVTIAFASSIAGLYTQDVAVIELAAALLVIAAFLQIGDGTQAAVSGALRGLKDTTVPMIFNAIVYWGIGFTIAYYLAIFRHYGGIGVWIGLAVCIWIAGIFLIWRFHQVVTRHITQLSAAELTGAH